jgi:hypothetical protein
VSQEFGQDKLNNSFITVETQLLEEEKISSIMSLNFKSPCTKGQSEIIADSAAKSHIVIQPVLFQLEWFSPP